MNDETEASVLGSLPRSRPQRRSDKRAKRPAQPTAKPKRAAQQRAEATAGRQAKATPQQRGRPWPASLGDGAELLETVVKAALELTEIGLMVGARALRGAVSRLLKP